MKEKHQSFDGRRKNMVGEIKDKNLSYTPCGQNMHKESPYYEDDQQLPRS